MVKKNATLLGIIIVVDDCERKRGRRVLDECGGKRVDECGRGWEGGRVRNDVVWIFVKEEQKVKD